VRVYPGEVTRIFITFNSYVGKYVLHCHIIEHEDNDMMRTFAVIGVNPPMLPDYALYAIIMIIIVVAILAVGGVMICWNRNQRGFEGLE